MMSGDTASDGSNQFGPLAFINCLGLTSVILDVANFCEHTGLVSSDGSGTIRWSACFQS